jgi:hypothetical protein
VPLNRGAADAGQGGRFLEHGIRLEYTGFAAIETAPLEQTLHSRGDPHEQDADLFIGRRREGSETKRVTLAFAEEDAVEEQRVEMDVQIQSAAKALDDGHRPDRPSRIQCRRARCRWNPSSTRTDTPSTARASG